MSSQDGLVPDGFAAGGGSENSAHRLQPGIKHDRFVMLVPWVLSLRNHWQAAGLSVSVCWPKVHGCAPRPGRHFQGASRGLGSAPCRHGPCETSQDQPRDTAVSEGGFDLKVLWTRLRRPQSSPRCLRPRARLEDPAVHR
jgi:hypothetical protein